MSLCTNTPRRVWNSIKDAPKRVKSIAEVAAKAGINLKETLWLQGEYDFLAITEANDETAAVAMSINILKQGNVTSQTMRAFTSAEMEKILAKVG